ncbi:MAG: cyclophilin-like fold protein [Nanoarchaeota archaeon]
MKIKIKIKEGEVIAELNKSKTAREIFKILPIRTRAERWCDEIYFDIPLKLEVENPQKYVKLGDLAFWLEGSCFCIFFGKTPISKNIEQIKPASEVNVFGKILEGMEILKRFKDRDEIVIEKI